MNRTIAAAVVACLSLTACGSKTANDGQLASTLPPSVTTATEAPAVEDPAALGDEIGRVYVAGYGDVVTLLADRPNAAVASALLADLKETYIRQMVALGYRREALDGAERGTVDARISSALRGVPTDTFEAYQQVAADYAADTEVADLIADFNIIGQYANFDLLRDQAPEEAARLGIG